MAYDKHVWTCGEAITTEKLNHMEDGIASGGGGAGYTCEVSYETLTEESVTTAADGDYFAGTLSYSQLIDADTLIVTFNGVEYECPRIALHSNENAYGGVGQNGPDFSQYPFAIVSSSVDGSGIYTETAGTYTIKIETSKEVVNTTECFEKAVKKFTGYECTEGLATLTEESVTTTAQDNFNRGTLSYSQFIDADTLTITFDGVEYECPRTIIDTFNAYGGVGQNGPDFSQYPFGVMSASGNGNILFTKFVGAHSIKIEVEDAQIASVDPCFTKVVKSITGEEVVAHMTIEDDTPSAGCVTYTLDITDADVANIVRNGSKLKIIDGGNYVYYPVNMYAQGVAPAVRVNSATASLSIIMKGVSEPLTLVAMSNESTPRYLHATECSSNSR